jgi:hypothetical protein
MRQSFLRTAPREVQLQPQLMRGVVEQKRRIWEDGKVRRRHCGTWQTAGPCAGVYWIALGRDEEMDDGIARRFLAEDCILC